MSAPPYLPDVADFFGGFVATAVSGIDGDAVGLRPEEEVAVARAVPRRRREFATGRRLAHQLLERLGMGSGPLVAGTDRAPLWPEGAIGSIAHTRDLCMVAVGPTRAVESVGVDVEPDEPLEPALWERICGDAELAVIDEVPAADRGALVRLVFSAKEAFYKYQYPMTGRMLDFHDVQVEWCHEDGTFVVRPGDQAEPLPDRCYRPVGRFVRRDGWLITGIALEAFAEVS